MKRSLAILLLILSSGLLIVSCDSSVSGNDALNDPTSYPIDPSLDTSLHIDSDIIQISEKNYVNYVNEVYLNQQDYIGKTIELEGIYTTESYDNNIFHFIYRQGPGCCGSDGQFCGFEFTSYDHAPIPKPNDWIRVTGTLHSYTDNGETYLRLDATNMIILDQRGAETVA